MKITNYKVYEIDLPLRKPFTTSFATIKYKKTLILELVTSEGLKGYSECSAFDIPFYSEEFRAGALALLTEQLLPQLLKVEIKNPDEIYSLFAYVRRNNMAKAAINCALWDLYAKEQNLPLFKALGGVKNKVEVGVSIGVQDSPKDLVEVVRGYIKAGYRRIKMKIKPGSDYDYLKAVRTEFPQAMLMADANSAYRLKDAELLKRLDDLDLIMIEQPLEPGDIVDHARLQAQLKTPICLDESIVSLDDARKMVELGAGKIINIKVARVGGFGAAKQIQAYAGQHGIQCWCGGMLDSGIARAGNLAIATLANYTLPNDIAACERYYAEDIISPLIKLDGTYVNVPTEPGLGYEVDYVNLKKFTKAVYEG